MGGPSEAMVMMWNGEGITLDGELVYPAAPHPRWVAIGICQGSCLGGIINPNEHCFLYGSGDALGFPTLYGETAQFDGMTNGGDTVINGRRGPKMFLVSVPKCPTSFTNVLYFASQMVTLISVNNISFVSDAIFVLRGY